MKRRRKARRCLQNEEKSQGNQQQHSCVPSRSTLANMKICCRSSNFQGFPVHCRFDKGDACARKKRNGREDGKMLFVGNKKTIGSILPLASTHLRSCLNFCDIQSVVLRTTAVSSLKRKEAVGVRKRRSSLAVEVEAAIAPTKI